MDQFIGITLDNRYELLDVVGTGGMAVVYKALDHRLNRYVAVKILKEEMAADPDLRRRFHEESQAVAMLSHPNIVAVYDVSKTANLEYIVMELIDGITLKQYMKQKGGRLPWKEALHFITQIMRALRHSHGRGIIHRDIKPHNIMILRNGSVKVADFGIARVSTSQNTMTQQALGSVHYISPEQAKGSRVDARSDIYSAGVVLYEMLTGKLPYEGDSPVAVAIQHINSVPTPPREVNPNIPLGLEQITMKAMASNPNDRYPNASKMLEDLDAFRKNPSLQFNYGAAAAAADVLADLDDATRPVNWYDQKTPQRTQERPVRRSDAYAREDEDDEREERRRRRERSQKKKHSNTPYIIVAAVVVVIFLIGIFAFVRSNLKGIKTDTEEHSVPSLVGMLYDAAVQQYGSEFDIVIESEEETADKVPGTILEQDPSDGMTVKGDKPEIQVVVAVSPEEVEESAEPITMPNLVGKSQNDAYDELVAAGIPVGNIQISKEEYSSEYDEGEVISTEPSAGTAVSQDTKVIIHVSKGEAPVTVPSFIGQSRTLVEAQLKQLDLLGSFVEVESDEKKGTVLSQSVKQGTEVDKGTTITFEVSAGPAESEEPTTSPSATPTPSPSATPTPTPSTSPSTEPSDVVVDKTITVDLSGQTGEVYVQVDCDGETVYSRRVDSSEGSVSVPISGSGSKTVEIYVDGAIIDRYTMDFN